MPAQPREEQTTILVKHLKYKPKVKLAGRAQKHQKCCPWGFIWLFNCSVLVCCWGLDTILKTFFLVTSFILSESFRILLTALRIKISKPWVHLKWFLWFPLLNIPWNIAPRKSLDGGTNCCGLFSPLARPPSLSLPSTLPRPQGKEEPEAIALPLTHPEEASLLFPQVNEVFLWLVSIFPFRPLTTLRPILTRLAYLYTQQINI